ncbi:DUF3307 domain-containing protein [Caminicella sporogenes]|uniref:DUF3307 domain-containing protein n=1 Tax=Caminicella sporogenes TaxID=166485 RepID=UPI00254062D6|nr:DUF3307 domain-containing protein [Caminicella sporogenes]WIF95024.1 DUF3307 domain-containing protein [Caminicella sporogenes]
MIEKILWILLAHYIADYPLQGDFLAQTKGKYWYSLLAHSLIYGLTIALCYKLLGVFAVWKAVVLIASHMVIDYKKATAKNKEKALTTYLYIDQLLHIVINVILLST